MQVSGGALREPLRILEDDDTPGCWARWKGRLWSWGVPALAAVSIVGLAVKSAWATALGALGLGGSAVAGVIQIIPKPYRPLAGRVALLIASQSNENLLNNIYQNTASYGLQKGTAQGIIALLGFFVVVYGLRKKESVYQPVESDSRGYEAGKRFEKIFLPKAVSLGSDLVFCSVFAFLSSLENEQEPVSQRFSAFLSTYYGSRAVGKISILVLDQKILQAGEKTKWRRVKLVLTSAAPFGSAVILVPFDANASLSSFYGQGSLGFFAGIHHQAYENRFREMPISALTELQPDLVGDSLMAQDLFKMLFTPLPELVAGIDGRCRKVLAVLATSFIRQIDLILEILFCAWQIGWDLESEEDEEIRAFLKQCLGTLLASLLGTAGIAWGVDRMWSLAKRKEIENPSVWQRILDRLTFSLHVSPEILGLHPAYIFSIITHSIPMGDRGIIKSQFGEKGKALVLLGWGALGVGWASERHQIWSARRGVEPKVPLVFLTNAVLTLFRRMLERIP